MENNSTRSWWEKLRHNIPGIFAHQGDDTPIDVTPETRVLAARITERLIAHKSQTVVTSEQEEEWQHLFQPLSLMFTKYNMTQAYRKLNAEDIEARQEFQSMLLGALAIDEALHDQFQKALPPPMPHWLMSDDDEDEENDEFSFHADPLPEVSLENDLSAATRYENSAGDILSEALGLVTPSEDELPEDSELEPETEIGTPEASEANASTKSDVPEAFEASTELSQTEPKEAEQTVKQSAVEEGDEPLGMKYLVKELHDDPEFYRVVFALRYNNPGLFSLASKLADEPKLCNQLEKFFVKTKLGTQLTNWEIGKEP